MLPVLYLAYFFSFAGSPAQASSREVKVWTTSGLVEGFVDNFTVPSIPLVKWLGVRYAQDTSGQNRWRPPIPVIPELGQGAFDASEYGPACLQGRADGGNGTAIQSEDCLRINIIAPRRARGLPVYLYTHGGGFDSGASSDPKIDGSYLAAQGIVFASFNYRLSLWGFPHSSEVAREGGTQNLGLLDTRAAVEWLHANVQRFGGDPNKITLGGESVGAGMTNFYLSAYHKSPIVRGAIMQSGDVAQPMWPVDSQTSLVAAALGCGSTFSKWPPQSILACLRGKDGQELRKALLDTGAQFQPVTDEITIWKDYVGQVKQGKVAAVPLLIGTNKDEGTLIVEGERTAYLDDISAYIKSNNLNFPGSLLSTLTTLYPVPSRTYPSAYNASAAIWRDAHMLCHASNLAHHRTVAQGLKVWRYRWDHVADNLNSRGIRIGAFHGSSTRFIMGTWRTIALSPPFTGATEEQVKLSDLMVRGWTNFIKDPNKGPLIPGWQLYNSTDPSTLAILGLSTTGAIAGNATEVDAVCQYWNELLPAFPKTFPTCGTWTC